MKGLFKIRNSCLVTQLCPTLCHHMDCSMPGFPVLHHLQDLAQIYVHWVNDAIQSDHPLSSPSSAFNLFQHQDLIQWLHASYQVVKVLELQLQHHPSNEYSGLISFRMAWLGLFAVQGILKSLLQHHSSKMSILWHSDYFTVQLSHLYVTSGKTIALTIQTSIGKIMSL